MNKHITDNILYYFSLDKPEYAILLSGKWGSGKTYFIDEFIKSYNKPESMDDKKKFIKISLFGLSDVGSIDEQIFQNLHPVLASKYAKLTGNILKSAFKLGINIDFDGDGKKDGNLSTNLDKFNPLEFFTDKSKKDEEIVFLFDDLERTEIKIKEVLGYINYLVEQSYFKVIIVANEDKLIKNNRNIYLDFKEKVIGKTLEVRHNFPEVLGKFLEDNPIKIDIFDKSIIENVYYLGGYNNLRHIKQSIIDFNYIIKDISEGYLENNDFLSKLTYTFFALNIETKNGSLDEDSFSSCDQFMSNSDASSSKEESPVSQLLKKYNLGSDLLFPREIWVKIIYKSYITIDELNTTIGNLSFFLVEKEKEKERPSWVKLWYYRDLEDEEFNSLLQDVTEKFKNCVYETPELLLHAIALLVYFNQESLSEYCIKDIKERAITCLSDKYSDSEYWKATQLGNDRIFNGTGLGYMNDRDPDFLEIFQLVKVANKEIYDNNKVIEKSLSLDRLIESINSEDITFIRNYLLKENEYSPVFSNLSSDDFFNSIMKTSNKNLYELSEIISSRYSDNKTLNGRGYEFHLLDELIFWQTLKVKFESHDYLQLKVKKLILKQFEKFIIDRILNKMNGNTTK